MRSVDLLSEQVRLHAEMFIPKSAKAGSRFPAVILGPDWGQTAAGLRPEAERLTQAGFIVITFDYRGWGESDGRVVLTGVAPTKRPPGARYTTGVRELRGYVDPLEQVDDWLSLLNWTSAQPLVDADHIALRGAGLAAAEALQAAGQDDRIKAVIAIGPRLTETPPTPADRQTAGRLTLGQEEPPEAFTTLADGRVGAPIGDRLGRWRPARALPAVRVPTLIVAPASDAGALDQLTGPKTLAAPPVPGAADVEIDWLNRQLRQP